VLASTPRMMKVFVGMEDVKFVVATFVCIEFTGIQIALKEKQK